MRFFHIDFTQKSSDLNVPILRQTKMAAWVNFLVKQLDWNQNRFVTDYTGGSSYPLWNIGTSYSFGTIIRYGNINYYYINTAATSGNYPTNTTYWYQLPGVFIGLDERLAMNSQKLKFEYALNRWFGIATWSLVQWTGSAPPYTQIYIKRTRNSNGNFWLSNGGNSSLTSYMGNSSIGAGNQAYLGNSYTYNPYSFTIYVPNAVLSALDASSPGAVLGTGKLIVADFAKRYTRAGKNFKVQGY
jgi:hypothetical protein